MKKYILVLITILSSLFIYSCEKQEESHKYFTVNIDGRDYTYVTKTAYHYADKETKFGDMQIMGQNAEYGEYSHCVVNIEYRLQGDGSYTLTDLNTLMNDVQSRTENKYVHVHVNLGTDYKENIAKYRFSEVMGNTIDVNENNGYYDFTFFEPIHLNKTSYLGTPPSNAPYNIKLKIAKAYI